MSILQAILLGIIQGLTEFLPISSSAHLVLAPYLLGWKLPESEVFVFDVLVQMGTLVAVIIYFWRDLWTVIREFVQGLVRRKPFESEGARLGWFLILATIPAGLAGLLVKDAVEAAFGSPAVTAVFLLVTAALLTAAEWIGKRSRSAQHFNWVDALVMGLFQALSIFPGVSRSGATISGGMMRSLDRPTAARFSFLMSVPVMLAAGLMASLDLGSSGIGAKFLPQVIAGVVTAGVVGYLSIHWLLRFLTHRPLYVFAIYAAILGLIVLFVYSSRPQVRDLPEPGGAYTVAVSPEAAFLEAGLRECSSRTYQDALFINIQADAPAQEADMAITLGAPAEPLPFTIHLGDEPVVMIVHPANPAGALSRDTLQDLYTGQTTQWEGGAAAAIWSYPQGSAVRALFDGAVLAGSPLTSMAYLAPGPAEMVTAVAKDPLAIGYIPASMVTGGVKIISAGLPEDMYLPVLAQGQAEPQGALRDWLVCLQTQTLYIYLPLAVGD